MKRFALLFHMLLLLLSACPRPAAAFMMLWCRQVEHLSLSRGLPTRSSESASAMTGKRDDALQAVAPHGTALLMKGDGGTLDRW